ncbi:hypothetical protein [uncultured Gelidibacter sp.]|uniref:hypothetical protein n=1 Tax=uncultured Gelidibacter sp. TaxID=259318 RepID=UPI002601B1E6|nr:hypothetical protein [uncultured Gelidibacter sp.]
MFSKSCEYGLRAVIFRATLTFFGEKMNVITILKAEDFPPAFKAEILDQLAECNLFESPKSSYGSSFIVRETLKEIFAGIREGFENMLHNTTSILLANDTKSQPFHLKI